MSRKWIRGTCAAMMTAAALVVAGAQPAAAGTPDVRNVPSAYAGMVRAAAQSCGWHIITGPLLAAQLERESSWNRWAVSSAGAQGIAQFKPATWSQWGADGNGDGRKDPFQPADAIKAQANYMCHLASRMGAFTNHWAEIVLWGYNAGPDAVLNQPSDTPPTAEAAAYGTYILNRMSYYRP